MSLQLLFHTAPTRKLSQRPPLKLPRVASCVDIVVEPGCSNSRCLYAGTDIAAPASAVWAALSGYQHLQTFIPGLNVNKVLSSTSTGARLLQVGQAEVAFGWKFTARCVLDICEWPDGIPELLCGIATSSSDDSTWPRLDSATFPCPRSPLAAPHHDISFDLIEGDFHVFRGLWRMQQQQQQRGDRDGGSEEGTRLSYSLLVRPHPWLPVGFIQPKVRQEVVCNLRAVAKYVEANQAALLQLQVRL